MSIEVEANRTFDRSKRTNFAPAVFLTFPRTPGAFNRSDFVRFSISTFPELEGGIVAKEKHKDGSTHYHAALFGSFRRKTAAPDFQRAVQAFQSREENVSLAGTGCHLQFAHKGGTRWPFHGAPKPDMVDYLTVTTDKKPSVDISPRCFVMHDLEGGGKQRVWIDVDSLRDAYNKFDPQGKAGLLGKIETVTSMAQAGASKQAVILELAGDITKENSYQYNILMDIWKATPKYIPEAPQPDFTARPWQQLIIDRMMLPIDIKDNNHRGIWLCTPAGGGKSTLLRMLESIAGLDNVFTPTIKNNCYGAESMNGYEQQPIIIIDDVRAYTDSNQEVLHKGAFIAFAKAIASGDRLSYQLYGKRHDYLVQARVLITSNFPKPILVQEEEQKAFDRRYIEINTSDVNVMGGLLNLPRNLGYRGGLLMPVLDSAPTPAPQRRAFTPPDSGNPAPRARVRFNDSTDSFVLGTPEDIDSMSTQMAALSSPTPPPVRRLFEEPEGFEEHKAGGPDDLEDIDEEEEFETPPTAEATDADD